MKTTLFRKPRTSDTVIHYGTVASRLLRDIGEATNAPYLGIIGAVGLVIMDTVQSVRMNKDQCLRLTERTYELVCAIINVCRDTESELPPAMIRSIEKFSDTLTKIHTYMRRQVKGGFWRRAFRQFEDRMLLQECNTGLKHALDVFGVQSGIITAMTIAELQRDTEKRHTQLKEAIRRRTLPPPSPGSSRRSSVAPSSTGSRRSTVSSRSSRSSIPSLAWSEGSEATSITDLSMPPTPRSTSPITQPPKLTKSPSVESMRDLSSLPACPKIFKGRDRELRQVTSNLLDPTPSRIALLGHEGVGKTSLALSSLHHPDIEARFGIHRYFVSCEAATNLDELLSTISTHLSLERHRKQSKVIVRHLTSIDAPTVLVLDSLQSAWNPHEIRSDVEDFLSLLGDIPHLHIIVTMRGLKRPKQIRWTRPFLPPLSALPSDAAVATFLDISDVSPEDPLLGELINLTDHHPHKITAMASLASFEGCASLLARYKKEGESLLRESLSIQSTMHNTIMLSV